MASERRCERLQSLIVKEVSLILQKGLNDPRIGPVVVTRVKLTRDLKEGTIYVNPRGEKSVQMKTLRGLRSAMPAIQASLSQTLHLRFMPQLKFLIDESFQKVKELDSIFDQIKEQREAGDSSGTSPQEA